MVNHPSRLSANTARYAARASVISAARGLLRKIDNMTTVEFERGAEREEREALRSALIALDALLATEKP